jgi:hypothetical protein
MNEVIKLYEGLMGKFFTWTWEKTKGKDGLVYSPDHQAWVLWDFYPTGFSTTHIVYAYVMPGDRFSEELMFDYIIPYWRDTKFERYILSLLGWIYILNLITPTSEDLEVAKEMVEQVKNEGEKWNIFYVSPIPGKEGVYTCFMNNEGLISLEQFFNEIIRIHTNKIPIEEQPFWHTVLLEGSNPFGWGETVFLVFPLNLEELPNFKNDLQEKIRIGVKQLEAEREVENLLIGSKWLDMYKELMRHNYDMRTT